jgi:alkanesulfonate monooxygenase SsuD/methylene tetrahydromethanopterin reductase-like flavin-dependent oxidoreductase (luciferase family)
VCGLGLGQNVDEFEQMGTPFDKRGPRTEDMIRALRASWLDDPVRYDGPYFQIPLCDSSPKPLQRNQRGEPAVPILIGAGDSPKAKRRIAEMGDGWIVTGAMTDVEAIVAYRAEVEAIRIAAGNERLVAAYQRAFVLPHMSDVAPATGGPFGPAAWSGPVDELADKVDRSARAGIDHLVLDSNYWETCPSPRAWAALPDHLAPLVERAHAHDRVTNQRGATR